MKNLSTILLLASFILQTSAVLPNFLALPSYACIKCLCHSVSGCYNRLNCARYSISKDYWKTAGSLVLLPEDGESEDEHYRQCMKNENCVVGTINRYVNNFGELDCNCDGSFDCKDMLAIHLKGQSCSNPVYGSITAIRFNHCAKSIGVDQMLASEGSTDCGPTAN